MSSRFLYNITRDENRISGWIVDSKELDKPSYLEIRINNRVVATLLCGDRIDWRQLGFEKESLRRPIQKYIEKNPFFRAAFEYRVPTGLAPSRFHKVKIFLVKDEIRRLIWEDETNFSEKTISGLKQHFSDYIYVSFDAITPELETDENKPQVTGWMTIPPGHPIEKSKKASVYVNNTKLKTQVIPADAMPDPLYFTYWPERPAFRFQAWLDISQVEPSTDGYNFFLGDDSGQRLASKYTDIFIPKNWLDMSMNSPLPPLGGIEKTTPTIERRSDLEGINYVRSSFLFGGYSDGKRMERAIRRHTSRSFDDLTHVLDWGCGCGRLTQHLAQLGSMKVYGVDIDSENILWAQKNISTASFQTTSLDPPLPFEDNTFDLVTGLSVYTHLTEENQRAWLKEHRRVLKPGGLLAVSIAGMTSLKRGGLRNCIDFYRELTSTGFSDRDIGHLFGVILKDRVSYYRNTYHLPEYIHRTWSEYFNIAGIELGCLAEDQDLVIGIKR